MPPPAVPANAKQPGNFQVPPPPRQQTMKAAAAATLGQPTAEMGEAAKQAKIPSPAQHSSEILNQTRKIPHGPVKMAMGGFAVVLSIAYFTLFSNQKAEATALDVAGVTIGTATADNSHPRF